MPRLSTIAPTAILLLLLAPLTASARPAPTTNPAENYALHFQTQPTAPVLLGSTVHDDRKFHLGIQLNALGAGIDSVTLNQFRQLVEKPDPYVFQTPYSTEPNLTRPLALRSIALGAGTENILRPGDVPWVLRDHSTDHARYETYVSGPHATGPQGLLLTVARDYRILPLADRSQGYEVDCNLEFKSYSDQPLTIVATMDGPTTPPSEQDRAPDRQLIAGYENAANVQIGNHYTDEFTLEKPFRDFIAEAAERLKGAPVHILWFGTCSNYFDALVRLEPARYSPAAPTTAPANAVAADYVGALTGIILNPDAESPAKPAALTLTTKGLTIPPGATLTLPMRLFFAPKERSLLNGDYFGEYPLRYNLTLQTSSSPCLYCAPAILLNALVGSLGAIHFVTRDWGLAIIVLVCIVRLILHPITKRSQANMMRMGKMGPQIEKLREKFGDDKEALGKAQLELMKEQGIGPLLGCLPLFLQAPIFISLFTVLQTTFELRHAPFLYGLTWIHDLAQPDRLIYFPHHPIEIWRWHFDSLNLLPLLTGVVNFITQRINQKTMPRAMTPEQQQQQKMMQWMTLIFPLIMYTLPSGLNLYYLASTTIGVFEARAIRRHIKLQEAREAAEKPTLIDVKPTRASKLANRAGAKEPPRKKTGIAGWLANLQQQAEQLRNQAKKRRD